MRIPVLFVVLTGLIACGDSNPLSGTADATDVGSNHAGSDAQLDFPGVDNGTDTRGRDAGVDMVGETGDCPITCGDPCQVVGEGETCTCDCPDPVECDALDYCECRDESACTAIVNGPTCGLDCECEGWLCECVGGEFIGCVDAGCPSVDYCPVTSVDCRIVIDETDGCPECVCDEPPLGCTSIDDYCACAATSACRPLTNGVDCGWSCECDPNVDCDCGGTEFLACQPASCPAGFTEACDLSDGRCEIVWNDDGCPECQCVGEDDVCDGLDYCTCFASEYCEVVTDSCICPCDYECPGFEDCVCQCGGGDYLGCRGVE